MNQIEKDGWDGQIKQKSGASQSPKLIGLKGGARKPDEERNKNEEALKYEFQTLGTLMVWVARRERHQFQFKKEVGAGFYFGIEI